MGPLLSRDSGKVIDLGAINMPLVKINEADEIVEEELVNEKRRLKI